MEPFVDHEMAWRRVDSRVFHIINTHERVRVTATRGDIRGNTTPRHTAVNTDLRIRGTRKCSLPVERAPSRDDKRQAFIDGTCGGWCVSRSQQTCMCSVDVGGERSRAREREKKSCRRGAASGLLQQMCLSDRKHQLPALAAGGYIHM